jgi:hypothetical protein
MVIRPLRANRILSAFTGTLVTRAIRIERVGIGDISVIRDSMDVRLLSADHQSFTAVAIYRLSAVMSAHKAAAAELSRAVAARRVIAVLEHLVIADVESWRY